MKIPDFLIYYLMEFYRRGKKGGLLWSSPLRRAVFLVGMTITLNLFSLTEIIYFFIAKKNLIDIKVSEIVLLIVSLLVIQVIRYIYITKNRYELLISFGDKSFTLSKVTGYVIVFLVGLVSFISPFVIGIIIHNLV